jgi:phytoene/squalene synthetase
MILYNNITSKISKLIIKEYSTSFYMSSSLLHKSVRGHIFNIYAFVRFADEIVDTFHEFDKESLLNKFELDYIEAYNCGISLNPVLHSFISTMNFFKIPKEYVNAFFDSMKADLSKKEYSNKDEIDKYIYGSADVVGLMCLKVFCGNNEKLFADLKKYATKLGSAFQKVNFLRDLKCDIESLDRRYFPEINKNNFDENIKNVIVNDIENDFNIAIEGIKNLPKNSKFAVFTAFLYYQSLLSKIKTYSAEKIVSQRIRISNLKKIILIFKSFFIVKLNLV